jgi:protein-tyrosine phosphatase
MLEELHFVLAWPHTCNVLLQVGVELQPSHPNSFAYLQLPIYDMPEQDIVASFPAAFDFIEQAMKDGKQPCMAGLFCSLQVHCAV